LTCDLTTLSEPRDGLNNKSRTSELTIWSPYYSVNGEQRA